MRRISKRQPQLTLERSIPGLCVRQVSEIGVIDRDRWSSRIGIGVIQHVHRIETNLNGLRFCNSERLAEVCIEPNGTRHLKARLTQGSLSAGLRILKHELTWPAIRQGYRSRRSNRHNPRDCVQVTGQCRRETACGVTLRIADYNEGIRFAKQASAIGCAVPYQVRFANRKRANDVGGDVGTCSAIGSVIESCQSADRYGPSTRQVENDAHLPPFKRPRQYRFVDALPKNNYGKVLKTELRKLL